MPLYFTEPGLQRLKQKETEIADQVRASGAEVGDAAGMNCDWHDNAAFDEARRMLELNSRKLQEIRESLGQAALLTVNEQSDAVRIGSTVRISLLDVEGNEEEKTFTIGAYGETDTKAGLISYTSPMAAALMAHEEGSIVEGVRIGAKEYDITIEEILPPSARYISLVADYYSGSEM